MSRILRIVVEGFDASGKSTLGKALANRYGLSLVEAGPPPKDMLHAIRDGLNQFYKENVVHVRITPISNQCYQYREIGGNYHRYLLQILELYREAGAIFIHCVGVADDHVIKEYDTEEHIAHISSNEKHIRWKYESVMKMMPNTIEYNFRVDYLEDLFCKIDDRIAKLS